MTYALFLDDERHPLSDLVDAVVVRSVREFMAVVRDRGTPHTLGFDHDLGEIDGRVVPSGLAALHWLIDEHLECRLDLLQVRSVRVHSANPVGNGNIASLWNSFAKHIGSDVQALQRPVTHLRSRPC